MRKQTAALEALSAVSIASPFAFFDMHDGVVIGSDPTDCDDNSYGAGAIGGTSLAMIGTLGTAWSAASGWATLTGSTSHIFALAMTGDTAYDALVPATDGAMLVWGQIYASVSTNTNASPCFFSIGDLGAGTTSAGVRFGLDRANAKPRYAVHFDGTSTVDTNSGDNNSVVSDDTAHLAAFFLDFNALEGTMYLDGTLEGTDTLTGTIRNAVSGASSGSAINYIVVGGSYGANSVQTATMWEDRIRRVGCITFTNANIPTNVTTLVQELVDNRGLPGHTFDGI